MTLVICLIYIILMRIKAESEAVGIYTKLAIVIDPPNQHPDVASSRVSEFIQRGGGGVLIGGSGPIKANIFQDTVDVIIDIATQYKDIPVWIFPGHIDQIPKSGLGIKGLLNYQHIMGDGANFQEIYPPKVQEIVSKTLAARKIESIPTLYILCGDPNASVSKVSGILPLNLNCPAVAQRLLHDTKHWLQSVDCVYFESGSNASQPVNRNIVVKTRSLIKKVGTKALLFVSGGISTPEFASAYTGVSDYVVVGGHFERNGVKDTDRFVAALKK